jgi:hypothetical protein
MLSLATEVLFLIILYQMPNHYPENQAVDDKNFNDNLITTDDGDSDGSTATENDTGGIERSSELCVDEDQGPVLRRRRSIRRLMEHYGVPADVIAQELSKRSNLSAPRSLGSGVLLISGQGVEVSVT